jgi:hypothetical protein
MLIMTPGPETGRRPLQPWTRARSDWSWPSDVAAGLCIVQCVELSLRRRDFGPQLVVAGVEVGDEIGQPGAESASRPVPVP